VLRSRNPDVLTCIANLSNDEVFTPPEFANRMLDTLAEAWAASRNGANLWADKTVRFLDPCTKSGVFLREITSRLTSGLAEEIPSLEERVDHIVTKQVFGIGITYLTSLLARRSVYCSKHASGEHSLAKNFANDSGNIWFERMQHDWADGKCTYCGASKKALDLGEGRETHAYAFIHTDDIKTRVAELFGGNMQFDVIIGNPPITEELSTLREEGEMLWWYVGGWSKCLEVPLSDLKPPFMAVVAGIDLASLVLTDTGPVSFPAILHKAISASTKKAPSKVTIQEAVDALPPDTFPKLQISGKIGTVLDVCPLLAAFVKASEIGKSPHWHEAFAKASGLPVTTSFSLLDISVQAYRPRV
jgi:hypothetical protein